MDIFTGWMTGDLQNRSSSLEEKIDDMMDSNLERSSVRKEKIVDREIFSRKFFGTEGFQGILQKKPSAKLFEDRK